MKTAKIRKTKLSLEILNALKIPYKIEKDTITFEYDPKQQEQIKEKIRKYLEKHYNYKRSTIIILSEAFFLNTH